MKYLFLILITLGFVSCADTNPVGDYTPPTPPVKSVEVEPSLDDVRENVEEVDRKNREIGDKIDDSKEKILNQKIKIEEALAQAERLKENALAEKVMTELEALNLEKILKEIAEENRGLQTENEELSVKVEEQRKTIKEAKANEKITREKLRNTQKELENFRIIYPQAVEMLKQSEKEKGNLHDQLKDTEKNLTKEKEKSASRGVYKNWVIGLASIIGLYFLAKFVLMKYGIII